MKIAISLILVSISAVAAMRKTSELMFVPAADQDHRSLALGRCGAWGQFTTDSFDHCITKDGEALKMMLCGWDDPPNDQLWSFDAKMDDEDYCTGKIRIKDGGCLRVDGPIVKNQTLTVAECDEQDANQLWQGDGDQVWSLPSNMKLCLTYKGVKKRDPQQGDMVLLKKCISTPSLNGPGWLDPETDSWNNYFYGDNVLEAIVDLDRDEQALVVATENIIKLVEADDNYVTCSILGMLNNHFDMLVWRKEARDEGKLNDLMEIMDGMRSKLCVMCMRSLSTSVFHALESEALERSAGG